MILLHPISQLFTHDLFWTGQTIKRIKKTIKDKKEVSFSLSRFLGLALFISVFLFPASSEVLAADQPSREQVLEKRMEYYVKYSSLTLPWYYLAAVDQFERNIQEVRNDIPKREGIVAMRFSDDYWAGPLNPIRDDTLSTSIGFFEGNGNDGNQDGFADQKNDDDVMLTLAEFLSESSLDEKEFKKALKKYYGRDESVNQIMTIAKLYGHFETINLDKHAFPLPIQKSYTLKSTWGDSRGWGGRRIHEGTDLFASYGVPVRATTYGVIEVKGWNDYGGWRIGIRDVQNTYHYYAHLSAFNEEFKEGDIVEPGTVIGYVGSSGYGKKWTSGRFPPHLHYGMYKYNGRNEWAFDPYPALKRWAQEERNALKTKR